VAEAIVKLAATPAGEVPLRKVVVQMAGCTSGMLNEAAKQVQAGVLQKFGAGELNINN
jgi:hypothetical protein